MTEYWKSQARKYCEFCKCWFADNKVSIAFHESGKRHKENVQKHISQLTKKSAKDAKQKSKIDDDMKKMEEAAMAAYLKDVQNNADLTSQSINEMLGTGSTTNESISGVNESKEAPVIWREVKNEDGSSYYWNMENNETTWDPPDHYLSIADQEAQNLKEQKEKKSKQKNNNRLKEQKQKEVLAETKAYIKREKMRKLSVQEAGPQPAPPLGPALPAAPYGRWAPVVTRVEEQVDLQLPAVKAKPPPPVVLEPERVHFAEKRVGSLGDGPVEFKKRKVTNARNNIRRKRDDD